MRPGASEEFSNRFTRRGHKDGTTDSICMACFATVRASDLITLERAEQLHIEECPRPERLPIPDN